MGSRHWHASQLVDWRRVGDQKAIEPMIPINGVRTTGPTSNNTPVLSFSVRIASNLGLDALCQSRWGCSLVLFGQPYKDGGHLPSIRMDVPQSNGHNNWMTVKRMYEFWGKEWYSSRLRELFWRCVALCRTYEDGMFLVSLIPNYHFFGTLFKFSSKNTMSPSFIKA